MLVAGRVDCMSTHRNIPEEVKRSIAAAGSVQPDNGSKVPADLLDSLAKDAEAAILSLNTRIMSRRSAQRKDPGKGL